jgi:hypothetical protein
VRVSIEQQSNCVVSATFGGEKGLTLALMSENSNGIRNDYGISIELVELVIELVLAACEFQ